jgi:hypothetical protein
MQLFHFCCSGIFGGRLCRFSPVELAAHDHDAIDDEGGDAGAVLVDVVGDMSFFHTTLPLWSSASAWMFGAAAPVHVDALGIDEGELLAKVL